MERDLLQEPVRSTVRLALEAGYEDKPAAYFSGARDDIVSILPLAPQARVLEVGCGAGETGRAVLEAGKAGTYVGIELNGPAAEMAARRLSEVIVGNVESLSLDVLSGRFDAMILSEVLEHLVDPWGALSRLATCLRPGGLVVASSPNIAHWMIVRDLIRGRFDYKDSGAMDRTHLRWFTPATYRALFEGAGIAVDEVRPLCRARWKARALNWATRGRFAHLSMTQMMVVGHRP